MEYAKQTTSPVAATVKPRLIIHGGAGNIVRRNYPADKYQAYRSALLSIVSTTRDYMLSTVTCEKSCGEGCTGLGAGRPSALEVATYAVTKLEDNPLFNSGHGAVFTRDGTNELEASVMVSRGHSKRGVGVMGLRRVRSPILLARRMLEHGDQDLTADSVACRANPGAVGGDIDVPSAQGHTQLFGSAAEKLAELYGLDMVEPDYFFTQQRWDEHVRALQRERAGHGAGTWDAEEYLPQGTCGAVALDEHGVVCAATSTGGMTNKLTGRVGDTPVPGAGFWAEEWSETTVSKTKRSWSNFTDAARAFVTSPGPSIALTGPLGGFLADCLPAPLMYTPTDPEEWSRDDLITTRSVGMSGTGNGDSFLRINAVRTVAAMARWRPETAVAALTRVVGPGGELQNSAGDRWKRTGEGEGGMVGIECVIVRDSGGCVVDTKSEVMMDYNCGGMFRAWVDDHGNAVMSIWSNNSPDGDGVLCGEKIPARRQDSPC